jgi:hypothetical protein
LQWFPSVNSEVEDIIAEKETSKPVRD